MMKKNCYLTFLLLFCSVIIFAQNNESINVEPFKTLTVKGAFNVVLKTGNPSLHFQSSHNDNVMVENKNGVLSIVDKRIFTKEKNNEVATDSKTFYDIIISSPELTNLNLNIEGDFTINKNSIFFSTLNFNANIQGETQLNLNGEVFVGNFNDCGKITIAGTIDNCYLNLSNSADLNTTDLKTGSSSINHNR